MNYLIMTWYRNIFHLFSGEIEGVETARARVRELTPLIFCFDLPIIPTIQAIPDPNDPYLKAIQDQYNIQVFFIKSFIFSIQIPNIFA